MAGNRFSGPLPPDWGQQEFVFEGFDVNGTQALAVVMLHGNQVGRVAKTHCVYLQMPAPLTRPSRCLPVACPAAMARPPTHAACHQPLAPAALQLSGTLPPAWAASGSFTVLRTLSLDGNNFSGGLPDQWANLQAIETLTASSTGLGGPLPAWGPGPQMLTTM